MKVYILLLELAAVVIAHSVLFNELENLNENLNLERIAGEDKSLLPSRDDEERIVTTTTPPINQKGGQVVDVHDADEETEDTVTPESRVKEKPGRTTRSTAHVFEPRDEGPRSEPTDLLDGSSSVTPRSTTTSPPPFSAGPSQGRKNEKPVNITQSMPTTQPVTPHDKPAAVTSSTITTMQKHPKPQSTSINTANSTSTSSTTPEQSVTATTDSPDSTPSEFSVWSETTTDLSSWSTRPTTDSELTTTNMKETPNKDLTTTKMAVTSSLTSTSVDEQTSKEQPKWTTNEWQPSTTTEYVSTIDGLVNTTISLETSTEFVVVTTSTARISTSLTPTTTTPTTPTTPTTTTPTTTTPTTTTPTTTTPTTTTSTTTTPTTTTPTTTTPTTTTPTTTTPTTTTPTTTTPTTTTPTTTTPTTTTSTTTTSTTTTPTTTTSTTKTPTTTTPTPTTTTSTTTTPTTTTPTTTTSTTTTPTTTTPTTTTPTTTTPTTVTPTTTTPTTTTSTTTTPTTVTFTMRLPETTTLKTISHKPKKLSTTTPATATTSTTHPTVFSSATVTAVSGRPSITTSPKLNTTSTAVAKPSPKSSKPIIPSHATTTSKPPQTPLNRFTTGQPSTERPSTYVEVFIDMSWDEFCVGNTIQAFKSMLLDLLEDTTGAQVQLLETQCERTSFDRALISVKVYIADSEGRANRDWTVEVFNMMKTVEKRQNLPDKRFKETIRDVQYHVHEPVDPTESPVAGSIMSTPVIVAISVVLLVCVVSLSIISAVIRKRHISRQRQRSMRPSLHHHHDVDNYSLNSFSTSHRHLGRAKGNGRHSLRSLTTINQGFMADEHTYSNAMTLSKLSTRSLEMDYLEEELKSIPSNMPKLASLPDGAQAKNRYANVIPLELSRVTLVSRPRGGNSQYINANYVKGYAGVPKTYIATQAPLDSTVPDFWTMIWENQSQVIIMLMDWVEDGQKRCADYLPPSDGVNSLCVYGDYEIFLKKQISRDQYTFSCLVLKNMELNLCRDVVHFQYLEFPAKNAPSSPTSFINFVKEVRPYMEVSHGPSVVHCSTGTGRTGTMLAIDLCMQAYDDSKSVDIMHCVHRLRQDRAGAVHTMAHYAFIYKVMLEYANRTSGENTPRLWGSDSSMA